MAANQHHRKKTLLLRNQKITANLIGIAAGLIVVLVVLFSNAPSSSGGPTLGASVKMNAFVGGSVIPNPTQPKNFLNIEDLKPGASPVATSFTLKSENAEAVNVSLGVDQMTKTLIPDIPFAPWLELTFGENGELGTTTLATLATSPLPPFELAAGETKTIPVTVSLPIAAGDQAGGQEARISIVPEIAP